MIPGIFLGNIMVNCGDQEQLRNFYAELLGWEKCRLYGLPAVRSENGITFLFTQEDDYIPPFGRSRMGNSKSKCTSTFGFQTCLPPSIMQRSSARSKLRHSSAAPTLRRCGIPPGILSVYAPKISFSNIKGLELPQTEYYCFKP